MELTAIWHSVISIPTCFPSTPKNISFSTIISWFCIVTLLRLCGLRNSSAILARLKHILIDIDIWSTVTQTTFSTVEVIDLSLAVTECMSCWRFRDFLSYTTHMHSINKASQPTLSHTFGLLKLLTYDIDIFGHECFRNKKHLKNVGPIRHCEPPHAHSPGVASGTVAPTSHRCPRQRQCVTEGTAMAPWNGPNKHSKYDLFIQPHLTSASAFS